MRLKYLELYGFKSFANKTKLHFDSDFVAIVGPNGSGKSNISDAIRWVLGEQSAKLLRGTKMEDVIFTGTEEKSPMNMAQVIIGFDNSDASLDLPYNEFTVSRKVYRSGESEYYINKEKVRRKDVRALFFDTGIGKEGYSIIGQGRIEDILSSNNEDRRAIFEEASGISKYKYDKEESIKRLEKTQENLKEFSRDLEVKEKELVLLKKQADAAKKGIALTKELQEQELSFLHNKLMKTKLKKKAVLEDLEKTELDLEEKNSELEISSQKLAPYQEEFKQLEGLEQEYSDKLKSIHNKVQAMEKDASIRKEQCKFFSLDLDRFQENEVERERKKEAYEKEREIGLLEEKRLDQEILAVKEALKNFKGQEDLSDQSFFDQHKQIEEKQEDLTKKLHFMDYEKDRSIKEDEIYQENKKQALAEKNDIENQIKDLSKKFSHLEEEIKKKEEQIGSLEERKKKLLQEGKEKSQELESLQRKREKEQKQLANIENNYYFQKSIFEDYQGYYRSVQDLMKYVKRKDHLKDRMLGVFGDLIEVLSPYEKAISVCLQSSLQNIVVPSQEDGKLFIEILKKEKIGRVTFLPLDSIKGYPPSIIQDHEVLIPATKAIKADPKFEGIINHFLSSTVIVEDMEKALSLKKKGRNIRIVTLDGDLIHSWGSMVGGHLSNKSTSQMLNRSKRLEDLKEQVQEEKKQFQVIEKKLLKAEETRRAIQKEIENIQDSLEKSNRSLQYDKQAFIKVKIEKEVFEDKLSHLEKALKAREDFDLEAYQDQRRVIVQELEEIEKEKSKLEEQMDLFREEKALKDREKFSLENKLSYLERDFAIAKNKLSSFEDYLLQLAEMGAIQRKEKEEIRKKNKDNEEKLRFYEKELLSLDDEKKKIQEDSLLIQEKEKSLSKEIEDENLRKKNLFEETTTLEKTLYQLKLQKENLEEKEEEDIESFMHSYDSTREEVLLLLSQLNPIEASSSRIADIKRQLSQIGYFYYQAIEDYRILFEDVAFLKDQLSDLEASKEDILSLIKDLDTKMKESFLKSFQEINKKYNEIFQILFQGGEARLELDDNNVLEAGIIIEARPAGKKLQNLDLLSGGERSMTALALLFAIFSISPTPFCFLDEIDASLDEANIGRYVEYLRTLEEETQFIVITHRKTTMELAKKLYGVTMEEGVSQIFSLKFEDYLEEV